MDLLIGGDFSKWDGILDWKKYIWEFAFVKVSEGESKDIKFDEQWRVANGYAIRGAYSWFHYFIDPVRAVNKMLEYLGTDRGELPPVLDLEDDDGHPELVAPRALEWLRYCRRTINRTPIVYTSWGFANHIKLKNYTEFIEYPLWLAQYPWDTIDENWTEEQRQNQIYKVINNPSLYPYPTGSPAPFIGRPDFVQWTAKCPPEYVPGYPLFDKKAVDINFSYMTMPQLFEKYKITYIPKPREDDMSTKPVTMTADLKDGEQSRLRNAAGTVGTSIFRTLTGPLVIKGTGQKIQRDGYWWIEVIFVNEEPVSGWVALTTSYINIVWLQPAPSTRTVVKSTIHFDDGSSVDTFPR